jgi:hypothetical protein
MTTSQTIKPTTMAETVSTSIEPTLHILSSTSPLTTTTITHMMKTAEEEFSKTSIEAPVESETISTSIPSSTSPKPSHKSPHILFSILFVIICGMITALTACLFCWCQKRRHLVHKNLSPTAVTHGNPNDDINRPNKLSAQYNETALSNKPNRNFADPFSDRTF